METFEIDHHKVLCMIPALGQACRTEEELDAMSSVFSKTLAQFITAYDDAAFFFAGKLMENAFSGDFAPALEVIKRLLREVPEFKKA